MNNPIKVAIIDDHKIVLQGLRSLLIAEEQIEIIGVYQCPDEFLKNEIPLQIDVLLLDVNLGAKSGITLAKHLGIHYNHVKIIMLTALEDQATIEGAIQAGALGYITKETEKEELLQAICEAYAGRRFFSKKISRIVFDGYAQSVQEKQETLLSDRELEVLTYLSEGLKHKEMADLMCVSVKTVETHKANLQKKLNLYTTADLVKYALRNKIVEL
ncbi:response regulator transcription factor [Flammeovirga sp. SJP92]|uniref:response regulator n=1 Tax=Flammeovirga sp. SJP92 TaxID=1775430 RepID=UPI0007877CA4|nr:response regulator transcription factor [Flammeovirga sp. SJP92]KXX69582.1 hypothetical protein AVL50_16060 [Flammeovirga sp. SJP92]